MVEKMKVKILEFKVWQGSDIKVRSHNKRNGKWKINPNFKTYKSLISASTSRFSNVKEYEMEIE